MATLKDVAKRSGFSLTTVSRALNDFEDVNENTKEIIRKAARELKYAPNMYARSLVQNKNNRIGFIIFEFGRASGEDNFVYELMIGMQKVCMQRGYELVFLFDNVTFHDNQEGLIEDIFLKYSLGGLIIMGCNIESAVYWELKKFDRPVVCIDGSFTTASVGCITIDNRAAIYDVVNYLQEHNGRKAIMMLNGKKNSYACRQRLEGFKEARGEVFQEDDVFYAGYSEVKAMEILQQLIVKKRFCYDAIVCSNDMMAIGALRVLKEHGYEAGKTVDVVGFDNINISRYIARPLSTVDQNMREIGSTGVQLLLNMIENPRKVKDNKIIMPYKIIHRVTTGGEGESEFL
ncbi:MAG: LacI family DNA-binding transcriptional regulator [Lachnospiraceae bacterium]|nr:LacI family DNA-binding transcriptional regulator [Lachnospiraceae bacterium]